MGYRAVLWESRGPALRPPVPPLTCATPLPSKGEITSFTDEETSSYSGRGPTAPRRHMTSLVQGSLPWPTPPSLQPQGPSSAWWAAIRTWRVEPTPQAMRPHCPACTRFPGHPYQPRWLWCQKVQACTESRLTLSCRAARWSPLFIFLPEHTGDSVFEKLQ